MPPVVETDGESFVQVFCLVKIFFYDESGHIIMVLEPNAELDYEFRRSSAHLSRRQLVFSCPALMNAMKNGTRANERLIDCKGNTV